jgi:methylase of polypeptide subunit release factors
MLDLVERQSRGEAVLPSASVALVELGQALRRADYHFVTPTPLTIARVNARAGNERARSLTDVFGWNRLFHPALIAERILGAMRDAGVIEETAAGLRSTVRVSSLGDQLYFHSAFPTVAADSVFFGPDTYRFARQLRACVPALAHRVSRCVDIGCGAGAGAIELARMCAAASVHAVDINPAALTLTRVNALLADTPSVLPAYSDLLANVDGSFDLIVANPPYLVDEGERAYRNGGGDLGAGLSLAIVNAAIGRLAPGGTLLLYTAAAIVDGADPLKNEVARRMERTGMRWSYDEIDPDIFGEELDNPAYADADRIAAVWLCATKPASHQVYW